MKVLATLFVLSTFIAASCKAAEAVITVDQQLTWKSIFDAGFRPTHVRDGIDKCRQLNVHVKLRASPGGELLDLGVGDVEFSLREGHLLELVSFYGREYRSVSEVEVKSQIFWRMFGNQVTRRAEIGWFKVERTIDYSGSEINPPEVTRQVDDKNAINHSQLGDLSVFYSFRSANSSNKPMTERLSIALKTNEVMTAKLLKSKIEPPAGYEHVSLEPTVPGANATKHIEPVDGSKAFADMSASGSKRNGHETYLHGWRWALIAVLVIMLCAVCLRVFRRSRCREGKGLQSLPDDVSNRRFED